MSDSSGMVRFRDVFALAEFRALWSAQLLSVIGDQLARVALAVLVYDRTHSALYTALTYAASYLPWLVGGLVLSGFADRFPRRSVMVTCDVVRTVLVAVMALPGMPLALLVGLMFLTTLFDSPFKSARAAVMPDVLSGDRYVLGTAVTQMTIQTGTVSGFAVGGVVVGVLGVRTALIADAATFVASALLVRLGSRVRAAAASGTGVSPLEQVVSGIRLVFADGQLRTLMLLGWLAAFYTVPEPLAVPLAAQLRHGAVAAGLVFAAGPFGTALGSFAFSRLVAPPRRLRWMGALAMSCCGSLLLCLVRPGLVATIVILAGSGAFAAYQLAANAAFVSVLPNARRGQAFGLANAGMQVGQGVAYLLVGAAAGVAAPTTVIAVSGGLGAIAAAALTLGWRRHSAPAAAPVRSLSSSSP